MERWLPLFICLFLLPGLTLEAAPGKAKGAYLGARATEYPAWFKESFLDLGEDVAEAALRSQFDVIVLNMWGDREVTGLEGASHTEKSFATAMKVQFTPSLLFFDEAGGVVLRLNGYVPPARFKAALDWVAGRMEGRLPYRDYVASLEGAAGQGDRELIREPFFQAQTDLRRRGKAPRPLAVYLEQRDCPDCGVLHRRVLVDPSVRAALAGFDNVQLDMWSGQAVTTPDGRKLPVRDWARELDVKFAPGILLFDAAGREVIRWESGFRAFHTAGMFDYVKSGAWKTEPSFQRYLSARAEHIREAGRDVNIWRYADEP